MAVLRDYYLQLRAQSAAEPGSLPVTARQLESLVRLSEARARVELREEVTREDAEVGGRIRGMGEWDRGRDGDVVRCRQLPTGFMLEAYQQRAGSECTRTNSLQM